MKRTGLIIGSALMLFFAACSKELSDNFNTYANHPLNDTAWARSLPSSASVYELANLLAPEIIIDSFDASKDTTMMYGDSLSISIKAGECTGNAGPVTSGKLQLEVYRLRKKGDYIKFFKPTAANGYLLESTSAFFVRVTKEGKELKLAPGASIQINFIDDEEPKPNMQVFNGVETNPQVILANDSAFTWLRDTDTTWVRTFQTPVPGTNGGMIKGYSLLTKNLRWTAAERYVDSTRSKTKIFALLPLNYTNKNTAVFAVFANQKTVVQLSPDFPSRGFAAANIPRGTKLKIVTVSKIGTDMYLGTKDVNDVGSAATYSVTPEKKTMAEVLQFLNGL